MFKHAGMYDHLHRVRAISSIPEQREKLFQKGLREPLLCDDCEGLLNKWETYACEVLFSTAGGGAKGYLNGRELHLSAIDYPLLKLFFMSLLWRFGVTSIPQYQGAKLGPRHLERLRALLLSENPGDWLSYPCFITAVMADGKHLPDFIVPPASTRFDHQWHWSFVASGFVFSFIVSSHNPPVDLRHYFLTPAGTLQIGIRDIREIPCLANNMLELLLAHREREKRRQAQP
jgi:hypothetical protein